MNSLRFVPLVTFLVTFDLFRVEHDCVNGAAALILLLLGFPVVEREDLDDFEDDDDRVAMEDRLLRVDVDAISLLFSFTMME